MDKLGKNKYKCKQSELYNLKVFFRNYLPNIYFLPKKNPMDGGAWWATVHGVAKSQTRLSNFTFTFTFTKLQFSSVQSLTRVQLFATPWVTACQASLSITNSRSLFKLMSIESVMPFSHLILCRPLLLLPTITPSIRVFSNESTLHIRWPKYWNFSFIISPSSEYSGLISFRIEWFDLWY